MILLNEIINQILNRIQVKKKKNWVKLKRLIVKIMTQDFFWSATLIENELSNFDLKHVEIFSSWLLPENSCNFDTTKI